DALFDKPRQSYTRDLIAAIPLPEIDASWLDIPSAAKAPT
ncbi:ABC transporter ATP-binding protein, partial [Mesorhizobium sp. M7A.F.Ca.MR.228.00.0.0]